MRVFSSSFEQMFDFLHFFVLYFDFGPGEELLLTFRPTGIEAL